MRPYVAFFDDSGSPDPSDRTEFFTFGMVVIPFELIQKISDSWWDIIRSHMGIPRNGLPPILNLEAKSADLYNLYDKLRNNANLRIEEQRLVDDYWLDENKVSSFIRSIWDYLSTMDNDVTYLGAAVNKHEFWKKFKPDEYDYYNFLVQNNASKRDKKSIRMRLQEALVSKAFEYLLQRTQYLMEDNEGECIVIGDETCHSNNFYSSQAFLQAGFGNYTNAENIINNVVFGSSLHNPGLQISDWIAYAIRNWATDKNSHIISRFNEIKHNFRNGKNNPFGRGIVLIPSKSNFPQ
ncbi:MAG: DUF3800 domain-containing protein [Firmicutes bacterium]|nr:DUF3800 domain-containing protein [Bacillota bacterium]